MDRISICGPDFEFRNRRNMDGEEENGECGRPMTPDPDDGIGEGEGPSLSTVFFDRPATRLIFRNTIQIQKVS